MLSNSVSTSVLAEACVDADPLVDYANAFFDHQNRMTYEEVCELCLELRGTQAVKVKHMLDLRRFMTIEFDKLRYAVGLLSGAPGPPPPTPKVPMSFRPSVESNSFSRSMPSNPLM